LNIPGRFEGLLGLKAVPPPPPLVISSGSAELCFVALLGLVGEEGEEQVPSALPSWELERLFHMNSSSLLSLTLLLSSEAFLSEASVTASLL
jgi:hypothetical protein